MLARYATYRCEEEVDLLHCVLEGASIAIEEVTLVSGRLILIGRACGLRVRSLLIRVEPIHCLY